MILLPEREPLCFQQVCEELFPTQIDSESWRFEIDVYDSMELLPWIRTFTGRIISLKSTNSAVVKQYYEDLEKMALLLGGE